MITDTRFSNSFVFESSVRYLRITAISIQQTNLLSDQLKTNAPNDILNTSKQCVNLFSLIPKLIKTTNDST